MQISTMDDKQHSNKMAHKFCPANCIHNYIIIALNTEDANQVLSGQKADNKNNNQFPSKI